MYIAPSTEIHILKNIPLNKSYENTVYYANADAQAQAFLKYNKFTLSNYSYQRSALGTIRVQLKYEQLYDCDYLMFKNSSFENKWFYCFITGVAYISNEVSEIYYEMDVMQTWCYNYKFLDTYIERAHDWSDTLYENTQPEGLELGKIYRPNTTKFFSLVNDGDTPRSWFVMLLTQTVTGSLPAEVKQYGISPSANVYSGLNIIASQSSAGIADVINKLNEQGIVDSVVAFYMSPCNPADQITGSFTSQPKAGNITTQKYETLKKKPDNLDGYVPKNNKLYTFPYTRIRVTNNSGIENIMHPEYFGADTANFTIEMTSFPQAMAKLVPTDYLAGVGNDYSMIYGNFPTCGFSGNTFQLWLAQNKNNYIATLNAIQSSFDTNMAISQNNYSMAARSANASAMMSTASINTGYATSISASNTALGNAKRSAAVGAVGTGVSMIGHIVGLDPSGLVGDAVSAMNQIANVQNVQDSTRTEQSNAGMTAATALENAALAKSTALKNASTSQASSALSALTAKANATAQLVGKKNDIENMPNSARGNAICDAMNFTDLTAGFTMSLETVSVEYAKKIDGYFSVYGYAQNEMWTGGSLDPRVWREHFTYLKTVGCAIKGDLNANDQIAIQSIYDNGITTWKTLEDVGNYDLSNGTII